MRLSVFTRWVCRFCLLVFLIPCLADEPPRSEKISAEDSPRFVDLSLIVAPEYPCTWPAAPFPRFRLIHDQSPGPNSPYHIDTLLIDGNTGTQFDAPPHSVARPDLNREKSGPFGLAYSDKIEPWQFCGEACVIDVRDLLDKAPNGTSPLITRDRVERFEQNHRKVHFGDVVLFRSGFSDKYYQPLPEGKRFVSDPLDRKSPAYPGPDPDCMDFLGGRGVMNLAIDSTSMGPLPTLAEPTHYAGLKYGMIWTESATNLAQLPDTGAFYCFLGPRHKDGPYGEGRAFAIVGGALPDRLINSARDKRAIDLTPVMAQGLPLTNPGSGAGQHRQPYLKVDFLYSEYLDLWHHCHLMDAMAGAHLVPPAFAIPSGEVPIDYSPQVRGWLDEYERLFGKIGVSSMTTDQVPISWTCGNARVIDVTSLKGTTDKSAWPDSPQITPRLIEGFEKTDGPLQRGDIVLFRTDHVDLHLKPDDPEMWSDPLNGKSEGWPALSPEAVMTLRARGIRCVGTDAPDLGGVNPKRSLMMYWTMGRSGMVGVEFLSNLKSIPKGGYFLFAAVKVRGCHGGPGRAIVLY